MSGGRLGPGNDGRPLASRHRHELNNGRVLLKTPPGPINLFGPCGPVFDAGYATVSFHWQPFLVPAGWVFGFFLRNMLAKDKSMSRYPDFAEYKRKTGLLFAKFW